MWTPDRQRSSCDEPNGPAIPREEAANRQPAILAITGDDRLYCLLLSAPIELGWKIS